MAKLDWLGDDGPLVLLADAEAAGWLGIWRKARKGDPESEVELVDGERMIMDVELDDDEPATDYARACAALDEEVAALVPFASGTALALETTGHQAAFTCTGDSVVIAKWIFASDEKHAALVLASVPDDLVWRDTEVVFSLATKGVRLHPAASRTEADVPTLPLTLAPGRYAIDTTLFEPDEDSSFELFRLRAI
jgi:hypothetical protein